MSSALRRTSTLAARALARRATAPVKTSFTPSRGYAADPNAPPKVPYPWNDPMNPSNWKEEHVRARRRCAAIASARA
jgi:hypothetical protein